MSLFRIYLYLIICVKITFLFFSLRHLYFRALIIKNPKNDEYKKKLDDVIQYKNQTEFIFSIMMGLLIIFIFNPNHKNEIYLNNEAKLLLYLFGIIIIITSDWSKFISNSLILDYFHQKL
jgi:hypothetical protein